MFTSASPGPASRAGSNRTPPPITTTSTGRAAGASAAPPHSRRLRPRRARRSAAIGSHAPSAEGARLVSLDPIRNHVRVFGRLASEEVAREVDRIGIQPGSPALACPSFVPFHRLSGHVAFVIVASRLGARAGSRALRDAARCHCRHRDHRGQRLAGVFAVRCEAAWFRRLWWPLRTPGRRQIP